MKICNHLRHAQIKIWCVIVFILIFNLENSCGQEISIIDNNLFEHNEITYDKYSISKVLESNEEAYAYYNSYIETTQNKQKERLAGAIGMIGGGIVTYYGIISALSERDDSTLAYVGLVTFTIGSGLMIYLVRATDFFIII